MKPDEESGGNGQEYRKRLTEFQNEYLKILRKWKTRNCDNNTSTSVAKTCQNVWTRFSEAYRKSPTHANNNTTQFVQASNLSKQRLSIFENASMKRQKKAKQNGRNDAPGNQEILATISTNTNHSKILKYSVEFISIILMGIKMCCLFSIFATLSYGAIVLHKPTESFILRNTQDLIYPFMRQLRLWSLPIIVEFPSLTDLYEDSCFFTNPYFTVDNIECWPCEAVRQVMDFQDISNYSNGFYDNGIPFLVKNGFPTEIETDLIFSIYLQNEEMMKQEHLMSNLPQINTFQQLLMNQTVLAEEDFHLLWKINRVSTARILRRYFPKPFFIPSTTEVSIQHFLYLDQWKGKSYSLPLTEFTNVFVTQTSGKRYIVLIPTFSCQNTCKVVSIVLHPRDILFYNWLYWRPVSFPTKSSNSTASNSLSITYIGSFY